MTNEYEKIELQLIQALNLALHIENETSYSHAFDVKADSNGFLFIPRLPASYTVDSALYDKIFAIASALMYPSYTLLKQNGAYFKPIETDDWHTRRALFFPWVRGIAERLVIDDIDSFAQQQDEHNLPIMENYKIDIAKVNHLAIAGESGSGKTSFLLYLLYLLKNIGKVSICDPKLDVPSRFARAFDLPLIAPFDVVNKNDFLASINAELSRHVDLIHERQRELYRNPGAEFEHCFVVIDELLALSDNVNKAVRDAFQGLLSTIALLGRATRIHLILVSQRFDANALSTSTRDQLNMIVQLGHINDRTVNFLLPDVRTSGIVIPQGIGAGLIQVIDSEHPTQVMPLLTPTVKMGEMF